LVTAIRLRRVQRLPPAISTMWGCFLGALLAILPWNYGLYLACPSEPSDPNFQGVLFIMNPYTATYTASLFCGIFEGLPLYG
jgi:hypothetical protein